MKIAFSPPFINDLVKAEVNESLDSGWITTGPKVNQLENMIADLAKAPKVLCVNSWTSGAMLILNWLGVQKDDEVIIPAYTYCATALAVMHAGAKPVLVDINDDFNISVKNIANAITSKTKAIIPVDIAGWPCDYDEINNLVQQKKALFNATSDVQKKLGRILVMADAAHSIGAKYKGKESGNLTDVTVFSLHAVKNITTAEGGAVCLNLPEPFSNDEVYATLRCYSLNGQTKDAFTKSQAGSWRYDIIYPGLKINMPDVLAAIGIGQLKVYSSNTLIRRFEIFEKYNSYFSNEDWALLPQHQNDDKSSSCHLYALRIKNANENTRDKIIALIAEHDVASNVHFQPLPLLSVFKNMGYDMKNYPNAYAQYENEISLPIYPQLTDEQIAYISQVVIDSVRKVLDINND
ncbi:DegT/DnrJ/EryC1/StrS family aminotransferase [Cellulophaga tyrosinoxydans]|uniref:dTDP-4-amino-4,6-dideoxygalactose transaminase n=1 Tax=Cellulophaga tyrosinoxydans TaxID=504486 RepID=A0A1W2AQF7_9FLAO|nr:DegT/DnrJ/EryC1/StrS family aminotransferase [Cellulophaga tyrosinoxydans]SMC62969.1 dTDP-4-amino-4,6-dideoxygalactose transaminase [Cellulophaga tyrosinoxydans]